MLICSIFDVQWLMEWVMQNASYLLVFLLMVVESSFIPFPSEVIVPPAAYLAASNYGAGADMNVYMIVIVATAGALGGAMINYYLSLWIGRPLVYKFADSRVGHALMLNSAKVDHAEKYFDAHGSISTFIGRLIPAVRQLISIPAGLSRMNIWKFCLFTSLGAMIWNAILAGLGAWLSTFVAPQALVDKVEEYNHYLTIGGYILLGLCIIYIAYKAFKRKK